VEQQVQWDKPNNLLLEPLLLVKKKLMPLLKFKVLDSQEYVLQRLILHVTRM
jgi:hypothetical protein